MSGREARIILLGTLLALCSSGPYYVAPDYLASLQRVQGFTLAQLGYVSGAENLMISIACAATGIALRRAGWRFMLAAALVCIAGDVLTIFATTLPAVLAVRGLTGLLGEGPLYAMSYAVLGSAVNPDRAFGFGVGSVAITSAGVLAMEGWLTAQVGPAAVLVPYAGLALALAVLTALTRPSLRSDAAGDAADSSVALRAGAILTSLILWSAAAGAFWSFTGVAASVLGVSEETMSRALAIALTAGLVAMAMPVLLGNRFGRVVPLFAATAGLILSCFIFFAGRAFLQLAVALTIVQFCWNIAAVYQLAAVAAVDRSGRSSAFSAVAQIGGMALGPALSGVLLGRFGFGFLPFAVAGISVAALILFIVAIYARAEVKTIRAAPG